MEITVDIVDWGAVKKKADQGTLSDELFDIEGDEHWISKSRKWTNESFNDYCSMGTAYEIQLPNLDEHTRSICEKSLSLLLNETADMPKDLGAALDPEYYVGTISPSTLANILKTYNGIDHGAFLNVISQEVIGYVDDWISVLKEAVSLERGLLVYVG